jgi:hypothetical protein
VVSKDDYEDSSMRAKDLRLGGCSNLRDLDKLLRGTGPDAELARAIHGPSTDKMDVTTEVSSLRVGTYQARPRRRPTVSKQDNPFRK